MSDPALALQPALDAVKADAEDAQTKVDNLIKGQKVGNDVEARLAAQSFWHRKERVLDSIKDQSKLVAAVQDLIRSADDAQVPVLAEELRDYLASRGAPAGWLPTRWRPSSRPPPRAGRGRAEGQAARRAGAEPRGPDQVHRQRQPAAAAVQPVLGRDHG